MKTPTKILLTAIHISLLICVIAFSQTAGNVRVSGKLWPKTSEGFSNWLDFIWDEWRPQPDEPNEVCQEPDTSADIRVGDCDDFAVMIAYYAEEEWGYDSFIIIVDFPGRPLDHAVAYVRASIATANIEKRFCEQMQSQLDYPRLSDRSDYGFTYYIPIDDSRCPNWEFAGYANPTRLEWEDLRGKRI
jgi:hypothetical protein